MIILSNKWGPKLVAQGETGMGYQIATIVLKDGEQFKQAVIVGRNLTRIRNMEKIPFEENDIDEIVVTHDKWDFDKERINLPDSP